MSRLAHLIPATAALYALAFSSTAAAGTTYWTGAELYADWTETSKDTTLGTRQYSVEGDDLRIIGATSLSCNGGRCGTDRTFNIPVTCVGDVLSMTVVHTAEVSGLNHIDNDLLLGIGDQDELLFTVTGDTGTLMQWYHYATDYNTLSSYNVFVGDFNWRTDFSSSAGPITSTFTVDRSAGSTVTITGTADQGSSTSSVTSTVSSGFFPDGDLQWELVTGDRFEEYVIHSVELSGCEYESGTTDSDGDGIDDDLDNCPDDANAGQADLDEDGLGDACDSDADGDGDDVTVDCDDLDPSRFSTAVEVCDDDIDNDCDGLVDLDDTDVDLDAADSDCDGDGLLYADDNCVDDYNPGQSDLDGDLDGDVCDLDDDGDGIDDLDDNCPVDANASQADTDGDGDGDACDDDSDGDGVLDVDDVCLGTVSDAPTNGLGQNRWADIDGDGEFDTKGKNASGRYFTMDDTLGCSCEQIIDECGYGSGHVKHGCSNSVMDTWTGLYDASDVEPGSCKSE